MNQSFPTTKTPKTRKPYYVGVDYSITAPSICIAETADLNQIRFEDCRFFYLTDTKKYVIKTDNIQGSLHKSYDSEQQRHWQITSWVIEQLSYGEPTHVWIEDYAFRALGRTFNLAENCGLLKHTLWKANIPFDVMSPSHVKKCASGKGNADKEMMHVAFQKETGVDLKSLILPTKKLGSPVTDIVDSFYVLKTGLTGLKTNQSNTNKN